MFFKQFNEMMVPGVDITLTIRKTGDQLNIAILPRSTSGNNKAVNITPLTLYGSPEDLDEKFFETVNQPIQKVSGLLSNSIEFEEQATAAITLNNKQDKSSATKTNSAKKQKQKQKYNGYFKLGEEEEKKKNYKQALKFYQMAKDYAEESDRKIIENKISAMEAWEKQGNLFDIIEQPENKEIQPNVKPQSKETEAVPNNRPILTSELPGEELGKATFHNSETPVLPENELDDFPEFPIYTQDITFDNITL